MGLARFASGMVGCLPERRNWLLLTFGYFGSATIGPGPEAGGLKPPSTTTQPTEGLDAKTGGAAGSPEADGTLVQTQSAAKVSERETGRDMTSVCGFAGRS